MTEFGPTTKEEWREVACAFARGALALGHDPAIEIECPTCRALRQYEVLWGLYRHYELLAEN